MGAGGYLTLLPALGTLFLLLACLVQPQEESFALSWCILLCSIWLSSLEGLFFSEEEMDLEDEHWKEWMGETVLRMCCRKKESIFNINKNIKRIKQMLSTH